MLHPAKARKMFHMPKGSILQRKNHQDSMPYLQKYFVIIIYNK